MEVTKLVQSQFVSEVDRYIKCGLHGIVYGIVESPWVQVHKKTQVDEAVCEQLGREVNELFYNGGTVVLNHGDILLANFDTPENGWITRFAIYFVDWLKNKGLNAELVDNDVLVDGCKVCGLCITRYGRIDYSCAFIGINTNLDHIKAICKKPMNKVPKGLSEYGITTEEVEQMFLDFCEQDEGRND